MTAVDELPPAAYAVALSALRGVGGTRLRAVLDVAPPDVAWRHAARRVAAAGDRVPDPADLWRRVVAAGVDVHLRGDPAYPAVLLDDPEAPALLYSQGDPGLLRRRRAAIVGTRNATHYGRDVARELGRHLAEHGVAVISGLALGIDGAAHEGVLGSPTPAAVGVVGSGLDVTYPRRHARLWERVREQGLLLSEAPLGAAPEPWRFPERNRIIAGLSEVVVVVESRRAGGSMHTVRAALDRDVAVMAVPGSVRSRASEGTNQLIAEGATPVTDPADVILALGLTTAGTLPLSSHDGGEDQLGPDERKVLAAVDWTPTRTEDVLRRTGFDPATGAAVLNRLEMAGLVRSGPGWWERT
jgi:DNA processing protein